MQIEEYIDREYAELVRIRELLEDIEFILEYAHCLGIAWDDPDGNIIRSREYLEAPLESLRKDLGIARQQDTVRTVRRRDHQE